MFVFGKCLWLHVGNCPPFVRRHAPKIFRGVPAGEGRTCCKFVCYLGFWVTFGFESISVWGIGRAMRRSVGSITSALAVSSVPRCHPPLRVIVFLFRRKSKNICPSPTSSFLRSFSTRSTVRSASEATCIEALGVRWLMNVFRYPRDSDKAAPPR